MSRRDFDIFEKFPDGSTLWRACVSGQYEAQRKLQELAEYSNSAFFTIEIEAGGLPPFDLAVSASRDQIKKGAKRIALP